jgi:erythromycin esterase-like protein
MMLYGNAVAAQLAELARPLSGAEDDYNGVLERIGDARFVLIGVASHGTHEFYRERAVLTRRLILEQGFNAVAVEADWPDAYRVDCFVRGRGDDLEANEALQDFQRFPTWMWRNTDVLGFVEWLHAHNLQRDESAGAGFYGLDLYSLHASMEAVLRYLDKTDPATARRARQRYSCSDHFGADGHAYGYAAGYQLSPSCEDEVIAQLVALRVRTGEFLTHDSGTAADAFFFAGQNARLVRNAEHYYRSMFRGRVSSWNLRDRHMMETFEALVAHLSTRHAPAKLVVWAHNSHLGDARATELGNSGELSLGQLVRQQYPDDTVLIGMSTYAGTITAAADWGAPAERKRVRPGLPDSYEMLLHQTDRGNFWLDLNDAKTATALTGHRLQRAIGVIYRPETERQSHYFNTQLTCQFDLLLHFDETHAVKPLELSTQWHYGDLPETYPSGA